MPNGLLFLTKFMMTSMMVISQKTIQKNLPFKFGSRREATQVQDTEKQQRHLIQSLIKSNLITSHPQWLETRLGVWLISRVISERSSQILLNSWVAIKQHCSRKRSIESMFSLLLTQFMMSSRVSMLKILRKIKNLKEERGKLKKSLL
jgi:hypothetical protein